MTKRLLLLGVTETQTARAISQAQALDCEVIIGDSAANLTKHASIVGGADQLAAVDFRSRREVSALAGELTESGGLTALVSFKEDGLLATAEVQRELGLHGNPPEVVAACIDKISTRRHLARAGLRNPRYAPCRTREDLTRFARHVGGPIVVKPHNLQGSIGVLRVNHPGAAEVAFERCLAHCSEPTVLAEEFLEGKEMSMEGLVLGSETILLSVTEKTLFPGTFVEGGHTTPYTGADVSYPEYASLLQTVVRALGVTFGPLHVEFFLTTRGPIVGEVHVRYGGGSVPTLLERALGIDVYTPIFAELLGEPVAVAREPWRSSRIAGVRFFSPPPGTLRAIVGEDEARTLPGVFELTIPWKVGDTIPRIRASHDRGAYVILDADSRFALEERARAVMATVRLETEIPDRPEPQPVPAAYL